MYGLEGNVIRGFNNLLEKQKREAGECFVTTVLFDHEVTYLHNHMSIKDINPIGLNEYQPRGSTALYDAIGGTVAREVQLQRAASQCKKADKVIFAIMIDGEENSSTNYSAKMVQKMVR